MDNYKFVFKDLSVCLNDLEEYLKCERNASKHAKSI